MTKLRKLSLGSLRVGNAQDEANAKPGGGLQASKPCAVEFGASGKKRAILDRSGESQRLGAGSQGDKLRRMFRACAATTRAVRLAAALRTGASRPGGT